MADTVYSFHAAETAEIIATAAPGMVAQTAANLARNLATGSPKAPERKVYIHNGLGVVGAGICRGGEWRDTLRDDFDNCDGAARAEREANGLRTHERPDSFGR